VKGRPGFDLEWSASGDARRVFDEPGLRGEPVAAAASADGIVQSWRPYGGEIPRGKRPVEE